jgi:hypothetical protein
MQAILDSHPGLRAVVAEAPRYRLQAVIGRIEPGPDGRPVLVQQGFRLGAEYFYPASSVKLFAAVAAFERLAELRREAGLAIGPDTALVYHPQFDGEELADSDPSNLGSHGAADRITVRHEIRKLFLVSDNESFNRLYELVGQDRLAASLDRAGIGGARIVHRLEESRTAEQNRQSPRIDLFGAGFRYTLPERTAPPLPPPPAVPGIEVGSAHLAGGERVDRPMDFSGKNRIPLAELQRGLCMVVRPDVDCGGAGFQLSDDDRALLLEAMSQLPRESADPVYDPTEYPDRWGKPLLPGLARVVPADRLRIFNKTGQAYGFSIENAYVTLRKAEGAGDVQGAGSEAAGEDGSGPAGEGAAEPFFLAVVLYTNDDGVLNDDRYEYQAVAEPFQADLGEAVARWLWGDQ